LLSLELASFSTATQKEVAMEEREVAIVAVLADGEGGLKPVPSTAKIPHCKQFWIYLFPLKNEPKLVHKFHLYIAKVILLSAFGQI
jgi:hypothetical protein